MLWLKLSSGYYFRFEKRDRAVAHVAPIGSDWAFCGKRLYGGFWGSGAAVAGMCRQCMEQGIGLGIAEITMVPDDKGWE